MSVLFAPTARHLVNESNRLGIKKEDIVTILRDGEQYVLIYYK